MVIGMSSRALFGFGESQTVVSFIENGIVRAQEDVAEDPDRSRRWLHVQTHESADAHGHTGVFHLQNVLLRGEREIFAVYFEVDRWQRIDFRARHDVFADDRDLVRTDGPLQLFDIFGWAGQQRGTGIDHTFEFGSDGLIANGKRIDGYLPIFLTTDRNVE